MAVGGHLHFDAIIRSQFWVQNEAGLDFGVDISNGSNVTAFSNFGFRNSRWRLAEKMAEFLDVVYQITLVTRYICIKGEVCSICSFVAVHFVTSIHTELQT
jgi:hypothetical protein